MGKQKIIDEQEKEIKWLENIILIQEDMNISLDKEIKQLKKIIQTQGDINISLDIVKESKVKEIERLNMLIVKHHNVTEVHKIECGQICPICLKEERRLEAEKKRK